MKTEKPTVCGVIVAAGSGTRMGGVSKPLIKLGNTTLIQRVLEAFEKCQTVDSIVIVCKDSSDFLQYAESCKKPVVFAKGGATRTQSVCNGVEKAKGDFVCIHDCARPFITPEDIDLVVTASFETGASCACGPVYDTVKFIDEERSLIYTPDRDKLVAIQTPQVFKRDIYFASYAKGVGLKTTDDTALAEHAGFKVKYVNIGGYNFKLTDANDIKRAKATVFLQERGEK